MLKQTKVKIAALIVAIVIIGWGVLYMAGGAIPGSWLYPLKIKVNENIGSALAFSGVAEAKLQAKLVAERLKEAEELALQGKLNATFSADIQNRLRVHYEKARKLSTEAQNKGKYEVSATVHSSLEASFLTYEKSLTDLNLLIEGNDCELLIADLQAYSEIVTKDREQAIINIQTVAAAKVAKAATSATIEQADALLKTVQEKLPTVDGRVSLEAQAQIEKKLAEATSAQTKAKSSLTAEAYRDAYTSSGIAIQAAHETAIMIDSLLKKQLAEERGIKRKVEVNDETTATGTAGLPDPDTTSELDTSSNVDNALENSLNIETEIGTEEGSDATTTDSTTNSEVPTENATTTGIMIDTGGVVVETGVATEGE